MVTNEYDFRTYNSTMIMRSLTSNHTVTILNAFANPSNMNQFDASKWLIEKYPEANPKTQLGFDTRIWRCCVIMVALAIAFKTLSLIFLKVLVKKFQ
jgi:hypothetical protein